MIRFLCPQCGKRYSAKDELGGRSFRCGACGEIIQIPSDPAPASSSPKIAIDLNGKSGWKVLTHTPAQNPPSPLINAVEDVATVSSSVVPSPSAITSVPRIPPRTRRLLAESEQMQRAFTGYSPIRVHSTTGSPPEIYQIEYRVKSLARGANGVPVPRNQHLVEIVLTRDYPRQSPKCRILTPIFHPNFDPTVICVGDHWTAGERLVDLVIRIAEMLAFQAYNLKSPLDGEAAMWVDQHQSQLPLDQRDFYPPNLE